MAVSRENPPWKVSLKNHHNELRISILVTNVLPALRTVLTDAEYLCTESKVGDVARIDELIRILLTKDKSTFDGFCIALETNGYSQWANKLKGEGACCPSVGGCVGMQSGCVASWLILLQ